MNTTSLTAERLYRTFQKSLGMADVKSENWDNLPEASRQIWYSVAIQAMILVRCEFILQESGVAIIDAERKRQVSIEGRTPEHDDSHRHGELAAAGACYALVAAYVATAKARGVILLESRIPQPPEWPWEKEWWKPSIDPLRNLAKAGALIAAEIDRNKRAGK